MESDGTWRYPDRNSARAVLLFGRARHPFGRHRFAVIRRDAREASLLLEEVGLLRERLGCSAVGAAAQPRRRGLIGKAREAVERHCVGDILGLAAGPLGDCRDLVLVPGPRFGIAAI